MTEYRVYYLGASGHIEVGRPIECETDGEAMKVARDLIEGFAAIEVWRGDCHIGYLQGYTPPVNQRPDPIPSDLDTTIPDKGERRFDLLKWSLLPYFTTKRPVKARAETVAASGLFIRRRRCIVSADAFYEWKPVEGGKQPYAIEDRQPMAFAGRGKASSGPTAPCCERSPSSPPTPMRWLVNCTTECL
jgi:putative SOS response-associated peptidase YedK